MDSFPWNSAQRFLSFSGFHDITAGCVLTGALNDLQLCVTCLTEVLGYPAVVLGGCRGERQHRLSTPHAHFVLRARCRQPMHP